MKQKNISLVLVYHPTTHSTQPVPLCRIDDPAVIKNAARAAVTRANARAAALSGVDEFLSRAEALEARRLSAVLQLLVP